MCCFRFLKMGWIFACMWMIVTVDIWTDNYPEGEVNHFSWTFQLSSIPIVNKSDAIWRNGGWYLREGARHPHVKLRSGTCKWHVRHALLLYSVLLGCSRKAVNTVHIFLSSTGIHTKCRHYYCLLILCRGSQGDCAMVHVGCQGTTWGWGSLLPCAGHGEWTQILSLGSRPLPTE